MLADAERREFHDLLTDREDAEENRFVDLCVVWERAKTGETIWFAGGQWDRIEERYTGKEPSSGKVIKLREAQIEAARLCAFWFQEKKEGRDRDFFGEFLISDRGAGKTHLGAVFIPTSLIEFPRFDGSPAIAWMISSSHADREELDREIKDHFPAWWFRYVEWPKHEYRFVNGCKATHISAAKIDSLKKGRVDFILVNEAQKMTKRAPAFALGRIKDKGGLAVFAANPPTDFRAKWILDWEEKDRERRQTAKRYPIRFVKLDSSMNDTLDTQVADQVAEVVRDLDPRLAAADIDGQLLQVGQPAYAKFSKLANVAVPPDLGDITREFTKRRYGREFDYVGGADFQANPHMVGTAWRLFGTVAEPILWCVAEWVCENSVEDDLIDVVEEDNYTPESLLWIGDASGQWQDGKHQRNGRDSFRVFKARRWHIIPPTRAKDPKRYPANPRITDRVRLHNKLLEVGQIMFAPWCKKSIEAHKECQLKEAKFGAVPSGFYAHTTDTTGYVAWWCFPRPQMARDPKDPIGISVNPRG